MWNCTLQTAISQQIMLSQHQAHVQRKAKLHTVLGSFLQVTLKDDSHSTLIAILIDLSLCQPLLWHEPGRYQVCLTPIQKAIQQPYFYHPRVL